MTDTDQDTIDPIEPNATAPATDASELAVEPTIGDLAVAVAPEGDAEFEMPTDDATEPSSTFPDARLDPSMKLPEKRRATLSHSAARAFRQCARLFRHRYVDRIEVADREEALWLGSLYSDAHECRTKLLKIGCSEDVAMALTSQCLDALMEGWQTNSKRRRIRIVVEAMFRANVARWNAPAPMDPSDIGKMDSDFDVVAAEPYYRIRPRNPDTGAVSRTFDAPLRLDRLLRRKDNGKLWIHERKTAAAIEELVDWVWADVQTRLYARWVSDELGEQVEGVLYDIAAKPRHKQTEAYMEDEDAWKLRVSDKIRESHESLVAKKNRALTADEAVKDEARVRGLKSMAREVVTAEADIDFFHRVHDACSKIDSNVRYWHTIDDRDLDDAMRDYWSVTQQILEERKRGRWPKNTDSCRKWGTACEFVPLCKGSMRVEDLRLDEIGDGMPASMASSHESGLYRRRGRSGDERRVENWILTAVTRGRRLDRIDPVASQLTMDDIGTTPFISSAANMTKLRIV